MEINNDTELITLFKALSYIKYTSKDYDAQFLAKSPYLNNLLIKIRVELIPYYQKHGKNIDEKWPYIEDYPSILEVIRNHIKNIDNWGALPIDIKKETAIVLISPYQYKNETIEKLILDKY